MLRRNSAWSGTAKCSWRTARGGLSPVLQRCQKQRCCSTPAAPSQAPGTPNPAGFQGFPNPAVSSQTSPSLWSLGAVPVLRRELCQPHKEQTSSSAGTLTCVSAAGLSNSRALPTPGASAPQGTFHNCNPTSSPGTKGVFPFTKEVVEEFKLPKSETQIKQTSGKEDSRMLAAPRGAQR